MTTRQKIARSDMPIVRAAQTRSWSTCSNAPRADRYMSGNETATAASTVAPHEKAIFTLKYSMKNRPIGV